MSAFHDRNQYEKVKLILGYIDELDQYAKGKLFLGYVPVASLSSSKPNVHWCDPHKLDTSCVNTVIGKSFLYWDIIDE